jgi:hypothetical protein
LLSQSGGMPQTGQSVGRKRHRFASSPARVVELPRDIIQRIAHSPALTLRDLARMARTCKVFRKALLDKLDAEVQWLTDLTYRALGHDTIEKLISWLTAKPSKRRELFGPSQGQMLSMHNVSASEGSGSRPDSHMSESERSFTLENVQWSQHLPKYLWKVPILLIRDPRGTWMGRAAIGAYGAEVWCEKADKSDVITVPYIGLLLLMWMRLAESGRERQLRSVQTRHEKVARRKESKPPIVKESRLPEHWERARDTLRLWTSRCVQSFWLRRCMQPWGKISKAKRLRRR